jgi:SAM-dependent methyltransferase
MKSDMTLAERNSLAQIQRRTNYTSTTDLDFSILHILRPWIESALIDSLKNHDPNAPLQVLDVGCGNQPFRSLIEGLKANYTSIDAIQNPMNSVDVVQAIDSPTLSQNLALSTFDVVLCTEVMEHVFDWPVAFENLYKLTRPGGVVIITCPFFWPLHEEPYDFWRPTLHAIRRSAQRVGFVEEQLRTGGDLWDVLGTVVGNSNFTSRLSGPAAIVLNVAARVMRRLSLLCLRKRAIARFFKLDSLQGPFYLANLVILRRPVLLDQI